MRCALPFVLVGVFIAPAAFAGETIPDGPPWKPTWLEAKKEALSKGRPIFAYFTKKH